MYDTLIQLYRAPLFCSRGEILYLADRMTASTPVMDRNELFRAERGFFIRNSTLSVESTSFGKRMGAAGFEPAATWFEAKHSVQAELSARTHRSEEGKVKPTDFTTGDAHANTTHPGTVGRFASFISSG